MEHHNAIADSRRADTDSAGCEQWLNSMLGRIFQKMHVIESDNFDAARFRGESPNVFFYDKHANYFAFFLKNLERFF